MRPRAEARGQTRTPSLPRSGSSALGLLCLCSQGERASVVGDFCAQALARRGIADAGGASEEAIPRRCDGRAIFVFATVRCQGLRVDQANERLTLCDRAKGREHGSSLLSCPERFFCTPQPEQGAGENREG